MKLKNIEVKSLFLVMIGKVVEIIKISILKDDPKFNVGQMHYIVIAPNFPKEQDLFKEIWIFLNCSQINGISKK